MADTKYLAKLIVEGQEYTIQDEALTNNLQNNYYTKNDTDNRIGRGGLIIQKNGTSLPVNYGNNQTKQAFGANDYNYCIVNIPVPTQTSELTNNGEGVQDYPFITKAVNNLENYYTEAEVDNILSQLETNIDWKEAVNTYTDIATTYPNPQDGWTVNVKDTDYTYRYNGTEWVAISANAIPLATQSINGLMSSTDKTKLDSIAAGAEVNVQSDWNQTNTQDDSYIKNKPTIPTVNNGTLTIKQNNASKGTFTANQSGNTTIELTDTTYSSKTAVNGGTDVSLVTTGEKYTWNNKGNGTVTQVNIGSTEYNPSNGVVSLPAYPTDTGATSVQTMGNGNVVTTASYSASKRKLLLLKEITTLVAGVDGETPINTGDDLNTYYTIGTYGTAGGYVGSTVANSLVNKPTFDGGFRMYVESCGWDGSYVRQTIITKAGLTFVRTSRGATWTDWEKVISANPNSSETTKYLRADGTWQVPQDTNTTYTFATGDANGQIKITPSGGTAQNVDVKGLDSAAYTDKQNYWMIGRTSTSIPASSTNTVDLNTYVTSGNYYCGTTANAEYVTNHPSPSSHPAFNLIVSSSVNSSAYVRQVVLCYNSTDLWMRYSTNTGTTWSTWQNLASDTKIYYLNVGTMITFVIADGEGLESYNEPYPFNRTMSIRTDKDLRDYEVIGLLLNQIPQKVTFNWRTSISQDEISLTFNGIYIKVQGSPPQGSIGGKLVLIKKSEFYDLQDFVSITPYPITITL